MKKEKYCIIHNADFKRTIIQILRHDSEKIENAIGKWVYCFNVYPCPYMMLTKNDVEYTVYYLSSKFNDINEFFVGRRDIEILSCIDDLIEKIIEKSKHKFKVGDKVKVNDNTALKGYVGLIGTVIYIDLPYYTLDICTGVRFIESYLDPVEEEKIEPKYKVGDYVKVKENLEADTHYGGVGFSNEMCKYRGKIYKIVRVTSSGSLLDVCLSSICNLPWCFSDEMLEPAAKYKVGDCVMFTANPGDPFSLYNAKFVKITDVRYKKVNTSDSDYIVQYMCDFSLWDFWFTEDHFKKVNEPSTLNDARKIMGYDRINLTTVTEHNDLYKSLKNRFIKSELNALYGFHPIGSVTLPPLKFNSTSKQPEIDKVMPNEKKRAIAVKFKDGDVITVKCSKDDKFDIYTGVAHAIAKKMFNTNSNFKKVVDNLTVQDKSKKNSEKKVKEDKKDGSNSGTAAEAFGKSKDAGGKKDVKETKKTSKTKKDV